VRSPRSARFCACVVATLFAAGLVGGAVTAAAGPVPADAARPSDGEIEQALDQVRADPNLAPQRTVRTLRWIGRQQPSAPDSGWIIWLLKAAARLADSARRLMWFAGAVVLAVIAVSILRARERRQATAGTGFVAPTHVRDLDIRPETLPLDIGAAARALWDAGDRRAALALLYRGLLSRLIHVHRIPIRDSSTEGDCLELAARHLTDAPRQYAAGLIRVWQRFVYGGEELQTPMVQALCDGFAGALDGRATDRLPGQSA